ncbi:hypothetical protein D030_2259A, partial [Vibrio parahaemolyticus AQ3810]|jgi:hypothetical protein
MVF